MKRAALISVIVGAALAIVPAAFAVEMSDGGGVVGVAQTSITPTSQIDPAIQAVLVRNHDSHYVPLTGKALADFYDTGAVVTSTPSQDTAAFVGRPDILGGDGTAPATANSSSGTDWNALVPVLVFTGLLLATGTAVATRRRHQLSV